MEQHSWCQYSLLWSWEGQTPYIREGDLCGIAGFMIKCTCVQSFTANKKMPQPYLHRQSLIRKVLLATEIKARVNGRRAAMFPLLYWGPPYTLACFGAHMRLPCFNVWCYMDSLLSNVMFSERLILSVLYANQAIVPWNDNRYPFLHRYSDTKSKSSSRMN